MLTRYLFFVLICMGALTSYAQPKKIPYEDYIPDSVTIVNIYEEEDRVRYEKPLNSEFSMGFRLPTYGWGVFAEYGFLNRRKDTKRYEQDEIYNSRVLTLEIGEKMHPKEDRASMLVSFVSPTNYTYGKINNFYTAKLMFSQRTMLSGKPERNSIAASWVFGGGFSLGMQKPYYLNIAELGEVRYSDSLGRAFLGGQVLNRNYMKGFGEMAFIPGIVIRNGFHFDFARNKRRKSALEIGATMEYYFDDVQILLTEDAQRFFLGAYLSYQFGKISGPGSKKKKR